MNVQLEVCIDNLESLPNAIAGGATRIELCSSLALGGLTPSYGLMKKAAELSTVPVYAMIRPRQGDFLYQDSDIDSMLEDIHVAKQAGLQGIVFGLLTAEGDIDIERSKRIMQSAAGLGVTFHRAIDQCNDYNQAIEAIAELGCQRILTSGLAASADQGCEVIADMVKKANGRFSIMAGAGVNAHNVTNIVRCTGITEVHLSGKTTRTSHMLAIADNAKMGASDVDDFAIPVTSTDKIKKVAERLRSISC
ncbi:copper homeostasis protein CutC [Vibrio sp. MACH09]|uniref:copper homeostasis protein CutC n=1 Tax=Vibrio sp. MACH09 TaxID=3025122 RepID=UPI00278D1656|nr:copper homeostasis protein CutC [Vibrio sp. MACH09]GLO60017.1 copper homeostasis protein CutC [Vibrio sp. MACH09]